MSDLNNAKPVKTIEAEIITTFTNPVSIEVDADTPEDDYEDLIAEAGDLNFLSDNFDTSIYIKDDNEDKRVSIEQVEQWLGSDIDRDGLVNLLADLANSEYGQSQLKLDILMQED